jgi:hypothetical protein
MFVIRKYKKKKIQKRDPLPGGFEPPTFRLTAERAADCAMEAFQLGTRRKVYLL